MPPRKHTADIALLEADLPSSAERQAEIERILKLLPGTLDLEKVVLRARAREAHELMWLLWGYRVAGVETFDNPHPIRQVTEKKE